MSDSSMRGRFAPSPSGDMHLGNAWTALLAWLQVRQARGTMVLRIEDLDPDRSKVKYIEHIREDLHWLGLDWDEGPEVGGSYGPYLQSERDTYYSDIFSFLKADDLVYPCFCSRADILEAVRAPHEHEKLQYTGNCRKFSEEERKSRLNLNQRCSYRFRLSDQEIYFDDLVTGPTYQNPLQQRGDFVLRRSDGVFAYQLAVVADDAQMKITHVLRGEDLLPSTAWQIALYQALGWSVPRFAHVPLLYGPDGQRLSKRHGAISILELRDQGVKAQTIIGQLACWAGFIPEPIDLWPQDLVGFFNLAKLPKEKIVINPQTLFRSKIFFIQN